MATASVKDSNNTIAVYLQVYRSFYCQIIQVLPIAIDHFIIDLVEKDQLPGDLKSRIQAKETRAMKVQCLLDDIEGGIKAGCHERFDQLIRAVKEYAIRENRTDLKKLAEDTLSLLPDGAARPIVDHDETSLKKTSTDQSKVAEIFTKYYLALCKTLTDIDSLLPHLKEKNIISINNLEEMNAVIPSTKKIKVQKLMTHISGPLRAGNTEVFYNMLKIMEEYGNQATQQLASDIRIQIANVIFPHQEQDHKPQIKTPNQLSVQFTILLHKLVHLLDKNFKDKLESCKEFCRYLTISDMSNIPLFPDEKLSRIEKCTSFHLLFSELRHCWKWDDFDLLEAIVELLEAEDADNELTKYKRYLSYIKAMNSISDTNCSKFLMLLDKPYGEITFEEYLELKAFIAEHLQIESYVMTPFIRISSS